MIETPAIQNESLHRAVSSMLSTPVSRAHYQAESLQGGTLGDVYLLTGEAKTVDGQSLPFRIVLKTQRQWERPGDPASWHREYDLTQTELQSIFTPAFRWPKIHLAEMADGKNSLWMDYTDGISGARLTLDDLERAALELGRFQGRCAEQAEVLRQIGCLGDAGYMRRDFAQWTPQTLEYRTLRSDNCGLPRALQTMLIETQEQADTIFAAIDRLPQVLCHRDYWTENIFVRKDGIDVIDWDCAGWGAIGEDIASLIADETEASRIGEYYHRLFPAYYQGLREYMPIPPMENIPVREMILIKFGYRLLQQVMFTKNAKQKAEAIEALTQIAALPKAFLL